MTRPGVLKILAGSAMLFGATSVHGADDPAAIKAVNELLREVSRAYSMPRSMADEMSLSFSAPGMPAEAMKSSIRLAPEALSMSGIGGMLDIVVVDGTLYTRMSGDSAAGVRATLGAEPLANARKSLGMVMPYLPPHFALKYSEGSDGVAGLFGMSVASDLAVTGHAMVDGPGGTKLHEVLLAGAGNGTSRVRIDPVTKFIHSIAARGTPEGAPKEMVVDVAVTFAPKLVERHEPAIAFEAKDAKFYDTLDEYMMASMGNDQDMNPGIASGTPAPAFALLDQDGNRHTLEGYRGKVVVLDWWGIW